MLLDIKLYYRLLVLNSEGSAHPVISLLLEECLYTLSTARGKRLNSN